MNKYLIDILKETNTVIIPDLGALTVTDRDKGEYMFMPFLKHDDDKLSGYVANAEGIDEAAAKNEIAKYIREIKSKLDQGESFDVFGLGSFTKNSDGELEFSGSGSDSSESTTEEAPKVEEKKEEPKEEKKEAKKDEVDAKAEKEAKKKVAAEKRKATIAAKKEAEAKKAEEAEARKKTTAEKRKATIATKKEAEAKKAEEAEAKKKDEAEKRSGPGLLAP